MWPFRKPRKSSTSPTLKHRVDGFWKWFAENANHFYSSIEDKKCSDLSPAVSEAIDQWLPGMAWVFGAGENSIGHSFTLSGEGILAKQFVAEYWLGRAPALAGWTFYSSRQPSEAPGGFSIELESGVRFELKEFWLSSYIDDQSGKIDIAVWHPSIDRLNEQSPYMPLFLMLDELLGEHGTQNWIGEIRFTSERLKQAIAISELPELIRETEASKGWKKQRPTETYFSYDLKKQDDDWLRGDTVAGTSRGLVPLRDYLNTHGPCEHPLPKLGIDYVFVAIETSFFPKGEQVAARGEIEDAINLALESAGAGTALGGATGLRSCYIDFAIYDGENSISTIQQILKRQRVPTSTTINYFTADKPTKPIYL